MTDLWVAPPGDDGSVRKKQRKTLRRAALAYLVGGSLFMGTLTWISMQASTPVSTEDVLAEFRAEKSSAGAAAEQKKEVKRAKGAGDRATRGPAQGSKRVDGAESESAEMESAPSSQESVEQPSDSQGSEASSSSNEPSTAAPSNSDQQSDGRSIPAEGVYEWEVEGVERAPGVDRQLPRRSHRVITHNDDGSWTEHHIFSEQKEMWFELFTAKEGVFTRSSRNWVQMGPVTVDRTVKFEPPVPVSSFPFKLGKTWSGSWEGKTSGTYQGRTFDHTYIEIGGERVEVWGAEVAMSMKGEVEGRVVTRTWVSPKYNLAVKQYQLSDVKSGPGSYYSEWTGQTLSVTPQT